MATYPTCAATGCNTRRRRDQIMCRRCWGLVPEDIQAAVYGAYRPSAGIRQSPAWSAAVAAAIAAVGNQGAGLGSPIPTRTTPPTH